MNGIGLDEKILEHEFKAQDWLIWDCHNTHQSCYKMINVVMN
jgi:hypothetical protein